jgi:Arc/MetJ family transcription regulator
VISGGFTDSALYNDPQHPRRPRVNLADRQTMRGLQTTDGASEGVSMIFKGVRDGRPYPDHGLSHRQWAQIPPRQIRLDELVMTTTVLALDRLLSEDSTFYGDLFPHAVRWRGNIYLEDGLHRAVQAALRNRTVLHARVFDMDMSLPQHG